MFEIKGQIGVVKGKVSDSLNNKGVPNIQVYNESSKTYTTADSTGKFNLKGRINDTLVFLSMGYYGKVWIVKDFNQNSIKLIRRLYEIEPAVIGFPRDYNEFKKKFLEIEPPRPMVIDGFPRYIPKRIPELQDTNIIKSTGFAVMHPLTYLYLMNNKEEISKRKVLYLIQEDREQVIIDQKYNPQIVEKLTGLKNESLTDFILYCNFSHQFLFESTEYEILQSIEIKFKEYITLNKSKANP